MAPLSRSCQERLERKDNLQKNDRKRGSSVTILLYGMKAIGMKIIYYSQTNKTHLHSESFALSLVLKVRDFRTRKWPVPFSCSLFLTVLQLISYA